MKWGLMCHYVSQIHTKKVSFLYAVVQGALTYTVHMEMTTGNPLMEDEENLI